MKLFLLCLESKLSYSSINVDTVDNDPANPDFIASNISCVISVAPVGDDDDTIKKDVAIIDNMLPTILAVNVPWYGIHVLLDCLLNDTDNLHRMIAPIGAANDDNHNDLLFVIVK